MPFIMPAIMGGMALASMIKGGRRSKDEKALDEEQKRARQGMQRQAEQAIPTFDRQAGRMRDQARGVRNRAGNAQAMNYWTAMMGGDRAKMLSATAPQRGQINELYGGQARSLDKSNMRGTQKARAQADLEQNRVSNLAGLIQGQAPQAAQQLGQLEGSMGQEMLGWEGLGAGAQAQGWANYNDLMRGAFDMRQAGLQNELYDRARWSQLGGSLAGLAAAGLESELGAGNDRPKMNNQTMGAPGAAVPGGWQLPRGQLAGLSSDSFGSQRPWSGQVMGGGGGFNSRASFGAPGGLAFNSKPKTMSTGYRMPTFTGLDPCRCRPSTICCSGWPRAASTRSCSGVTGRRCAKKRP